MIALGYQITPSNGACFAQPASHYHGEMGAHRGHVAQPFVDGKWMLVYWTTYHMGGQDLYRKDACGWRRVRGGGGAYRADELVHAGVPRAVATRLLDRLESFARELERAETSSSQ